MMKKYELSDFGFRLFFLGASFFTIYATLLWMGSYVFSLDLEYNNFDSSTWHAHEMIFGYSCAVIVGFLLTAIRNWTGIRTIHGHRLLLLFMLWLLGRIGFSLSDIIPIKIIAITDCLFLPIATIFIFIPILKALQWRNVWVASTVLLLSISHIIFYLGMLDIVEDGVQIGLYSGIYSILAIIFTITKRVIPFFTKKSLDREVKIKDRPFLSILNIIFFSLFWILNLIDGETLIVATISIILCIIHITRLCDWYVKELWQKPLLWILHAGYFFIILGFALKALSYFFNISPYLSLHAFTAGGIGLITIGMMARVSLGHTGRSVHRDLQKPYRVIFIVMLISALIRVIFPIINDSLYVLWIGLSQMLWTSSFIALLYYILPILIRPNKQP